MKAVDRVSFSACDGEITGLLGPNGAGKTTILRLLYTLLKPDHGRVQIDGRDPQAEPLTVKHRIGALPDSRGLYTRLTARENVAYFGRLHGMQGETLRRRVDELIELLDFSECADRRTAGFSQGQRVKTAIARALVHTPQNVVLDEPTNGLDVMSTRALRHFLKGLKEQGHCILLSSHIMQEVAALCDRIVVIAKGWRCG